MGMGVFICHGIEWFDGDICLTCEEDALIKGENK